MRDQVGQCTQLADHRTAKLLSAPREGITEHPMYNRVKGPLFEHWKRAFSFALYKQTVECIHHGVTNAKTRQQQGNGPDGYDCDLHHEDLEARAPSLRRLQLSTAREGSAQE